MSQRKPLDLAGAVHGAAQPQPEVKPPSNRSASRQGKRGILIHVEPEMARRLKIMAAERDTTLQALGVEALTRLLNDGIVRPT